MSLIKQIDDHIVRSIGFHCRQMVDGTCMIGGLATSEKRELAHFADMDIKTTLI